MKTLWFKGFIGVVFAAGVALGALHFSSLFGEKKALFRDLWQNILAVWTLTHLLAQISQEF